MIDGVRNLGRAGSPRWPSPPSTSRSGISRPACWTSRSAPCLDGASGDPSLRQRRLHLLFARALQDQLGQWAEQGMAFVKMKIGRDPPTIRAASWPHARRSAARPSSSSTPTAPIHASWHCPWGGDSPISTFAGSRSRSAPTICPACVWCAIARPRDGHRGRRVRLRPFLLPPHAGVRRGRCPASGRHPMRRRQRLPGRARARRRPRASPVCALCACDPSAPRLRTARVRHLEYFHDHQRIERMLFDGAVVPHNGVLAPDSPDPDWGSS